MFTILETNTNKEVVNRSRFLGFVFYCKTVKDRESIVKKLKKEYYSATHICFAHSFFDGERISYFFSDDREPSGTAGSQILNAIKQNELIDVLCVVVRYFGGVKLGVQNLSKAYKDCALNVLNITKAEVFLKTKCKINCNFDEFNKINKTIKNLKPCDIRFGDSVSFEVMLNEDEISLIKKYVKDIAISKEKSFCL